MRIPRLLVVVLFFFLPLFALAQAKLEKTGPLTDAAVPAAVRDAVEASGARLVRPDGNALCAVWLRKQLPAPKAATAGAIYADLSPGMFVGVIAFPGGGKDFRGQAIKPGFYTMRYELLPEDGNHMGVAPTRDFVLLVPASDDTDVNAQYDFAKLVKLSAQAAGTNHPAAFVLLAPEAGEVPRTYQNPDGYQVFAGSTKSASGKNVAVAMVVKGQAEQ